MPEWALMSKSENCICLWRTVSNQLTKFDDSAVNDSEPTENLVIPEKLKIDGKPVSKLQLATVQKYTDLIVPRAEVERALIATSIRKADRVVVLRFLKKFLVNVLKAKESATEADLSTNSSSKPSTSTSNTSSEPAAKKARNSADTDDEPDGATAGSGVYWE